MIHSFIHKLSLSPLAGPELVLRYSHGKNTVSAFRKLLVQWLGLADRELQLTLIRGVPRGPLEHVGGAPS